MEIDGFQPSNFVKQKLFFIMSDPDLRIFIMKNLIIMLYLSTSSSVNEDSSLFYGKV
jgi:hypothetical protein